ncbi:triacylglycerol lipase [Didymella exigua CBS 183.55]|uniref:Patatin-like phospholipase domain-containing protein n=1 Tax=Didymella exigua CBS 183.55 TaxID=1150837 RepID=A0A6A5S378_9PLEO|nr:triacylglycerol lipase [Didymella exigua CBS 183.55]KAF1934209.1 triacylglycerol lipase [Didymella exigua CBS 183.55]
MSFLSDAVFSGSSTRLHVGGIQHSGGDFIRKSKSHGGFLSPLSKLVRNPVQSIGDAVGSHYSAPSQEVLDEDAGRKQILYLRLKNAETYHEWKAAAIDLDILEGNNAWKDEDESPEYDAALVAARLRELDDARLSCDVTKMLFLLRTTLTRDLGDMGGLRLYKHSHIGTKRLIERYIESAQQTMEALLDVSAKQGDACPIDPETLTQSLLQARQSFGRSALLLSGGGTLGMNHVGVVKSLWDNGLLPRIISGASAGSIVCAVLCTKTDAEIPDVLHDFCYGDLDVFEKAGEPESILRKVVRLCQTGTLFDMSHLKRVMRQMVGDMTFQESYNRTRRILNIPVSTSSIYELPRLLNYITAPNVMIWSAVCTSCSVPLVYAQSELMAKDLKTGKEVPWDADPDAKWIDGSVDNDLPMTRLAEMFNVNHFVVSQVNPHVVPFLEKEEDLVAAEAQGTAVPAGPHWLSSVASLAKGEVLHRLQVIADIGIFPTYVTKLRGLLSQRYSGDINIFPAISYADFPRVLSNPTTEYMLGCLLTGQRATWPKLSRIQNHVTIELALDNLIQKFRARTVFSSAQTEAHPSTLSRPNSLDYESSLAPRTRPNSKTLRFVTKTEPSSPVLSKKDPFSPLLSRSTPRLPSYDSHSSARNQTLEVPIPSGNRTSDTISTSTNLDDSSDKEYYAEVDSDTSEVFSSPSPIVSPSSYGPTLWPTTRHTSLLTISAPATPAISTSSDRHIGTLLNLKMTPASSNVPAPSSPELRYKRLYHPSGPTAPEVSFKPPTPTHMESLCSVTPSTPNRSPVHSRRGSNAGLVLDISGARGMLRRKKSAVNFQESYFG